MTQPTCSDVADSPGSPLGRDVAAASATSLRLALTCIVGIAACLRLYDLGVPSMWWDEALVPMTARLPFDTIVERSLTLDIHPPLFYLVIKGVLAVSRADWALRLIPALAGIAGVALLYKVGKDCISRSAGLFAAVLLTVNPLHLLLSRQVRPYTLVFDLALLSLWAFVALTRGAGWWAMLGLCLANLALSLLHFTALLVIGAEGAMLLVLACLRRRGRDVGNLALFTLGAAAAVGATCPFLSGALGANLNTSGGVQSLAAMAAISSARLGETFWYLPNMASRVTVTLLTLVGAARLYRTDRKTCLVLAGFALLPIGAVIATRFTTYFNPWHLTVLLPASLILAANGLALFLPLVTRQPLVAAVLCLALALPYPVFLHQRFYAVGSHSGPYKSLAGLLARIVEPGDCVVFSDQGLANAVLWYAEGLGNAAERLRRPSLTPDAAKASLHFVAGDGYGHMAKDEGEFLRQMGEPSAIAEVIGTRTYSFEFKRQPVQPLGPLPARRLVRLDPASLYAEAYALENVASLPLWGGGLTATANDLPGRAEFVFANTEAVPQRIGIFLGFADTAQGNRLGVSYAFDEGPWQEAFLLDKPLGEGDACFFIDRREPYARLRLRFTLHCGSRTPMYPGGNLESLRLKDFTLHVDPLDAAANP
ncbi:glycosyltransferase family 39 protein [Solidesulfovibrio sp.]|uniref:glycosyltransferase family 39 protein n=1 Tax=Solidesulfovibrio sp. TaxID=2910990 RepID=UPI002619C23F|nr:glycosyltransferase family 39 protein [Solidesulfovibrio sp.]